MGLFALQWQRRNMSASSRSRSVIEGAIKDGELRVFIVAGEVSGDSIGSRLMSAMKKLAPLPVSFSGVGGSMMSEQGMKSLFPMEDIAVMGIWELLPHIYKFRVRLKETIEAALLFRPHAVVTVDSKGFSFRLLKQLRARYSHERLNGPAHFHYVAPSFWAWKGGEARLKNLAAFVDHILCILPNEEAICRLNGLAATFVGHPVVEDCLELNLDQSPTELLNLIWEMFAHNNTYSHRAVRATVISLLPGSRLQEVARMLPIFAKTVEQLKDSFPELITVIHVAPNRHVENYITGLIQKWPVPSILVPGGSSNLKYDAFSASRVALCTSGTVAVELQLARLPCVVAYRAHFLTEWFIRYKAKIPYISLPNILLDSPIIPEALLQACTPDTLTHLLMELICDEGLQEQQIVAAKKVVRLLYPSERMIKNLEQQDIRWTFHGYSPSMIAAATVLGFVKP
ncbi:putative lipid-A-disaccharide synthase [Citrus sinensis]|uniref:Lipid-A-disaccharide synthase n=1 Tax=Citrus sinensis TaxID=2711 RepID=A0ACB8N5R3_CITSI|nr:putative lipid-A-disaccharide synthase [Citrus sinensis]